MTWQDRIAFDHCTTSPISESPKTSHMGPGLTGRYDRELREKASVRSAPVPPECMGLEGEYDDFGLVKRVARDLDSRTDLAPIDTLSLAQKGRTISFSGQVEDQAILDSIIETASRVDGTSAIDVGDVTLKHRHP